MIPALIAPLLAQGLNLLTNAALVKGKDWVQEKTGLDLAQPLSSDDVTKLRQFELEHEEELIRLRQVDDRLSSELEIAYLKDVQDARSMNARINESANATWLSKNVPAILALIVIVVGFTLLGTTKDADVRTAVVGLMTLVLGFYFGSTASSKAKDEAIRVLSGGEK